MLHCRTVLYSHSKRNRNCYPHYTANLLFPTTALSIFVVSIRVIFQYLKTNFLFIPQTIQQIKKNCNTKTKPHTDEQWEKDLEAELQDFEVVADGAERSTTNWEKDVDELLDDDETDLK